LVEIFWTDEAKKWLREIHDYIKLDNELAAKRVVNSIYQKVENLKKYPEIGQKLSQWINKDIRMILYGHYRIVYLIKNNERIDIVGIYHGALDLKKHLKID
jgi:plasmid stabilization system protein ParE